LLERNKFKVVTPPDRTVTVHKLFTAGAVEASSWALALYPNIGTLTAATGVVLRVPLAYFF
jgi:hypothetical protein